MSGLGLWEALKRRGAGAPWAERILAIFGGF